MDQNDIPKNCEYVELQNWPNTPNTLWQVTIMYSVSISELTTLNPDIRELMKRIPHNNPKVRVRIS